ncbi:MAG: hypothetical protein WA324_02055 [Bryobacteraceae bacterium]
MSLRHAIQWVKPSGILACVGGVALLVSVAGLVCAWLRPTPARAASNLAYTVMRTEAGFDNAGMQRYTNYYVEAQRADGSKVFRATTKDVQNRELYFANGDHVRVNELMGAKSTYPGEGVPELAAKSPETSCVSKNELAQGWIVKEGETIGGYRTARSTRVTHDGTFMIWYGLDLGCAVLQLRYQHGNGVTEQTLTKVIPGEPDYALFQLSAALNEVPPSALLKCSVANCTPLPDDYKTRIDQRYYDARAKAAGQGSQLTRGKVGS